MEFPLLCLSCLILFFYVAPLLYLPLVVSPLPIQPRISILPQRLLTTFFFSSSLFHVIPLLYFKPSLCVECLLLAWCSPLRAPCGIAFLGRQEVTQSRQGERKEGETKWVDGDDRNNETKQDRMKGEEKDEMCKNGRMMFSLGFRNLRRSSRGADQRKIMIGDGRRDVERWREEGGREHKWGVRKVKEKMREERELVKRQKWFGPQPESADVFIKHEWLIHLNAANWFAS